LRNDENAASTGVLLAAVGDDFECTIAAVMYHARDLVLPSSQATNPGEHLIQRHDFRPEWMQNWYDGLGYCKYFHKLRIGIDIVNSLISG
jgi:hypothetical protein